MNTLSKSLTSNYLTPEAYLAIQTRWKEAYKNGVTLIAAHHMLYLALLGRDWRKAFTPFSNPTKLKAGAHKGCELFRAHKMLKGEHTRKWLSAVFDGAVDPAVISLVASFIPDNLSQSPVENGAWPFSAYDAHAITFELSLQSAKPIAVTAKAS